MTENTIKQKTPFFRFFEIWFQNFWMLVPISFVCSVISMLLIPHGLSQAGITNVTRNIARDKHSFGISDFFDTNWMGRTKATVPAINVIEKKDEYKVQVAAPGMTKDDFRIHLDEAGDLVITMEKCCNCDDKEKECKKGEECKEKCRRFRLECKFLRREFSYAKFEQTLVLPEDVDKAHIKAKVKHGVLHIKLPRKVAEEKPQVQQIITIE